MADTDRLRLQRPAAGTRAWNTILDANAALLDGLNPIGALAVALKESPSASRDVKVAAGAFVKSDGTLVSYAGTSSFTCSASSTCKLYLADDGTLTQSTTSWPAANHVRLATVVTGASMITSLTDERISLHSTSVATFLPLAGGTLVNGADIVCGTTTGTKLGTGTTQKLAFWNATPIVQPAHAHQAALTNSTGGTTDGTLQSVGATNSSDVSAAINNNFAELHVLLDAIRTALVNAGLIKGSA